MWRLSFLSMTRYEEACSRFEIVVKVSAFGEGAHPLLAEYAEAVMEEVKWYNDVESGEKSAMPGTYAVMGLGLKGTGYFPLVIVI